MEELSQADNGTCMEVIHQNSDELYSSSLLVLGSEFKRVYIIDTSLFKVLETFSLKSTPVQMCVFGNLQEQYRIFIGVRDNQII